MAPNSPACSFTHASMAGSRSTAPLNRSNSVLIVAPLFSFETYGYVAYTRRPRACRVRRNERDISSVTPQRLRIASGSSAVRKLTHYDLSELLAKQRRLPLAEGCRLRWAQL